MNNKYSDCRFSVSNFGGDELSAYNALEAHRSALTVGASVRAYRCSTAEGVIVGFDGAHGVVVEERDGLRVIIEDRNLELSR